MIHTACARCGRLCVRTHILAKCPRCGGLLVSSSIAAPLSDPKPTGPAPAATPTEPTPWAQWGAFATCCLIAAAIGAAIALIGPR